MDFDFSDRNLQRAIYDSIRSAPRAYGLRSNSSKTNSTTRSSSTGFRANTLAREGIFAATKRNSYPVNKASDSGLKSSSNRSQGKANITSFDYEEIRQNTWISLDNGWFQLSPEGSGNYRRCGLHTLLECNNQISIYSILYTPRSREMNSTLLSDMPSYDMEANIKVMKPSNMTSSIRVFSIIFGYLSSSEYTSIKLDIENNKVIIVETLSGEDHFIYELNGLKLVWNLFSLITLQIRSSHILLILDSNIIYDSSVMTPNHPHRCKGLIGITIQVCTYRPFNRRYLFPLVYLWIVYILYEIII